MWKTWLLVAVMAGRAVADPAPTTPPRCKVYRPYLEPIVLYHTDFTTDFANHAVVRAAGGLRYRDCAGDAFRHQVNIGLSVANSAYSGNGLGGIELDLGWHVGRFVVGPHAAIESAFGNEAMTEWTIGARARALDAFVLELDLIRGSGNGATPVGMLAGVGLTGKPAAIGIGVVAGTALAIGLVAVAVALGSH